MVGTTPKDSGRIIAQSTIPGSQSVVTVRSWNAPLACGGPPTRTRVGPSHFVSVPDLAGKSLDEVKAALEVAHLTLDARGSGIGAPNSIVTQAPPAKERATPGDTVIVCWRLPPAIVPPVLMPPLAGLTGVVAVAQLDTLLGAGGLTLPVTRRWLSKTVSTDSQAVVDSQSPRAADTLTPQSAIELFLRDTTAPRVLMPNLKGLSQKAATDTLAVVFRNGRLTLGIDTLLAKGSAKLTSAALVVDQVPLPESALTAQSRVQLFLLEPAAATAETGGGGTSGGFVVPWQWIAAVVALLAIVAAALWRYKHLGKLMLTPHIDVGAPRLIVPTVAEPDADDELARLGMTLDAVADPGSQRLHFT